MIGIIGAPPLVSGRKREDDFAQGGQLLLGEGLGAEQDLGAFATGYHYGLFKLQVIGEDPACGVR